MRIVKQLEQFGHFQVVYVDMTASELLLVDDVKSQVTAIIDHYVNSMVQDQQFKDQTEAVEEFIGAIIDTIDCIHMETKFDPADQDAKIKLINDETKRRLDQWRSWKEAQLYITKAKAVGINVSDAEIEAFNSEDSG